MTAFLAVAGAAACELLLPTRELVVPPDAGPGPARCALRLAPGAPGLSAPASGSTDLVFATRHVSFDTKKYADLGYDIDGKCTCADAGRDPIGLDASAESCVPPQSRPPLCDGLADGRDVAGNIFLGDFIETQLPALTEEGDIDARIGSGFLALLFEVKRYGGGDGSGIRVGLYNASGLFVDEANPDAGLRAPAWDGGDRWSIDCRDNGAACTGDVVTGPSYFDPNAYVTGGKLVAHPSTIRLNLGVTDLRLSQTTIVATIDPSGASLQGQLFGRVLLNDMFESIAALHKGSITKGDFFCGQQELFVEEVRPSICGAVDVAGDSDKSPLCNAISVAIHFEAFPAKLGRRRDRPEVIRGCADAGYDDDCTKR